jgi:hypothetical protein
MPLRVVTVTRHRPYSEKQTEMAGHYFLEFFCQGKTGSKGINDIM